VGVAVVVGSGVAVAVGNGVAVGTGVAVGMAVGPDIEAAVACGVASVDSGVRATWPAAAAPASNFSSSSSPRGANPSAHEVRRNNAPRIRGKR
jgi:hypothetical protein